MTHHVDQLEPEAAVASGEAATEAPLIDRFGRHIDYLRIAVNDVCNLRCVYCMPPAGLQFHTGPDLMDDNEILRIIRVAAQLGVKKIRFTGGEPTLRRGLIRLIHAAATTPGIEHVALTTNGTRLGRLAHDLRRAHIFSLNISLDSLRPERFREITRHADFATVRNGVDSALAAGIPVVKLNTVVLRGVNDDELGDFVELTRHKPLGVRFIEFMPFDSRQLWGPDRFFSAAQIRERLQTLRPDLRPITGTATEQFAYRAAGHHGTVAVIPAYTRSLCGACNRLRLTADGKIRNCLYSAREFDILKVLRQTPDDGAIMALLRAAVSTKLKSGWDVQRQSDARNSMSQIGG